MVNDDVDFDNHMFKTMFNFLLEPNDGLFAIVGTTHDSEGKKSYGGRLFGNAPVTYGEVIEPNGKLQECADTTCIRI
jgi:hypothetical protein